MFTEFFYTLKRRGVPVSLTEWMALMEAMDKGYISNIDDFYFLSRAILVKSEAHYDNYDVAFQEYFKGMEGIPGIDNKIRKWLQDPLTSKRFVEDNQFSLDNWDLDELHEEFEKRLKEQKEQHDGGSRWIGRGGTSPFGHSGAHPAGIRIGGESGGSHAMQIAQQRKFRNYRNDLTLDIRQIKMALRGLRQLTRVGLEDELDLDETIQATSKNAGDIKLIWRRSRKNAVKVLLLMDVGGSMAPFANLCSQLFSAAHSSSHFKFFQYYYFHNCIYDNLFKDVERHEPFSTDYLLKNTEPECKLVIVGDARMGSWELMEKYGAIDYYERNEYPGIVWLRRFSEYFTHRVWLNPVEPHLWIHPTINTIDKLFPMFPLTIDGLGQAVKKLIVKR